DLTFGTGGKVTTDFGGTTDDGFAVAMQTDGKIVVAGTTTSGGSGENFGLARYLADGTPDPDFSGDGRLATDFAGGLDQATAVAVQADGKIVVAGLAQEAGSTDFAVARYTTD